MRKIFQGRAAYCGGMTEEKKQEVIQIVEQEIYPLYINGGTSESVARQLGISKATVLRRIEAYEEMFGRNKIVRGIKKQQDINLKKVHPKWRK